MKEIVIKIPDNTYKVIKDDIYCGILDSVVYDAIKNGTELPKGHGELKDSRIVDRFRDRIIAYGKDYTFSQEEVLNILGRYEGIYKEVLVKADKGDPE